MTFTDWEYQWATTPGGAKNAVWRAHRIDEILAGNTPRPLEQTPTVVVHIIVNTPDMTKVELPNVDVQRLAPAAGVAEALTRANTDGIAAVGKVDPTYVQVFRDHNVEYASSYLANVPNSEEIDAESLNEFLSSFLRQLLAVMNWKDEPRTYALTLLHVKDHRLPGNRAGFGFDRDTVMLPIITMPECGVAAARLRRLIKEANGIIES